MLFRTKILIDVISDEPIIADTIIRDIDTPISDGEDTSRYGAYGTWEVMMNKEIPELRKSHE